VSCEFTVSTVNSGTSFTVSPFNGCGGSGIGFTANDAGYWAVYTDDKTALQNALNAAASSGETLYIPSPYQGGIHSISDSDVPDVPSNTAIQCDAGGTLYNPSLNSGSNAIMNVGSSHVSITGCTFAGTEPASGARYDVLREYNRGVTIYGGSNVTFTNNTFKNLWGTYALGTSPATNVTISNNTFQNDAYYCVQLAECGGTPGCLVTNNTFIDSNYGSEDGGAWPVGTDMEQINYNVMYPVNGTGYNRTQTLFGLGTLGAVFLDSGTDCSGLACNSNQYTDVYVEYNHVYGSASEILVSVYGATVANNTCDSGCAYH
jgi:hypothetical protein